MTTQRINLLFCGHDFKFIGPFVDHCRNSGLYDVRTLTCPGHDIPDESLAQKELDRAQVIFCEWALGNAVWFSQRKRPDQVLLVRLHSQEVRSRRRTGYVWKIDWTRVDRLILITNYIYDWVCCNFPVISPRCSLIYNPIPAIKRFNLPKSPQCRFHLGMAGIVPAIKRLDLSVAVLRELLRRDSSYVLRIKGAMPSDYGWMNERRDEMSWYARVFDDLRDLQESGRLHFDPHGPDMDEWYQGIGHLLSVSDFEGSHQVVAEGMAAGCVPAIRNWEGAARIYPGRYVASTIEQLADMIRGNSERGAFERESDFCRSFSRRRFDEKTVCDQLEAVIHRELAHKPKSAAHGLTRRGKGYRLPTFLILAYLPIGSRNGYRIRVEQEIRILKRKGCRVHLACLVPSDDLGKGEARKREHIGELQALGCEAALIPADDIFSLSEDPPASGPATDALRSFAEIARPDVIHAEAFYCARLAAGLQNRLPGAVLSIDWHGLVPEETRMAGGHANRIEALEMLEGRLLGQSDLNIFVSRQMETHYRRKYGLKHPRCVVVPCCVSDSFFNDSGSVDIKTVTEGHLVFGYAGSMAEWQCGAEMVLLFSQLYRSAPECRFVFLVPEADRDALLDNIRGAGLPLQSCVVETVPHAEIPGWMRAFHVGVLLRKKDPVNLMSSPTKFAEYLAAGVPVLMTGCIGDYSEHARAHNVGFVVPESILGARNLPATQLSGILDAARDSRLHREETARRCRSAAQQLDWESAAGGWIDAYRPFFPASGD